MPYKVKGKCVYKKDTNEKVGCTKGSMKKFLSALHTNINESDFDWTDSISANMVPGKQYYIKTPSGLWTSVEYCGEGETDHPNTGEKIMGHRFKDINRDGKCNEWWSNESLKSKIDNNLIREYDPLWSVTDDIEFGTISDIKDRNFVIYFENGIDIEETTELQKTLFDMGFHFPKRGDKFEPVTNKDTDGKKIIMFECFNWDTSNNRYKTMPSDYRDKGIMLMVTDNPDHYFRDNKEHELQSRFSTVIDHDAVVVDGYPLLGGEVINESDFGWTEEIPDNPVHWVEPELNLKTVGRDEDGWPIEYGNGEGEVWVDFERFSNDERIEIIKSIEEYLGTKLIIHEDGGNIYSCTSNKKKGLIVHCGHEENHFFSQENHVCCMSETYEEFMEMERNENPATTTRPNVDGGIFLNKTLTEGFYYKGVNPTVDLIVIRGDKVLLIQRADDAEVEAGKWALPGGFHDTNAKEGEEWKEDKESSLDAAKREVKEETGLDVDSIKGLIFQMVGVFEGGGRDPRDKEDAWTRSTVYMVHIPEDEGHEVKGMDDAQRAEWVPIDKVLQHKLAFDHHKIIEKALSMNMNEAKEILKTLLTESDDFEWIKDTPMLSPLNSDEWIIIFNNERETEEIQRWLFSNGLCWDGHFDDNPEDEDCGEPWPFDGEHGFFFKYGENENNGGINAYTYKVTDENGSERRILDDFPNHIQYNWSDIGDQLTGTIKEDLDWIKDVEFKVTDDFIKNLMNNCKDIQVVNYNLRTKLPYLRRGKMNVMYYSMCPFWWDKLKDEPLDDDGRGNGEWFQSGRNTPNNSVAVIMPNRNGITDVRNMDVDDFSAITYDLKGISNPFNAKRGELWILLDNDGNVRYDLVPEHLVDEVKQGFEGVERSTTLEESFEWTDDIPDEIDFDLWEKLATDIDNEVSGPHSGNLRQRFPNLTKVLRKYNIDIEDMGEFFMAPPDGARDKDGNHITNHQLVELQKDLIRIGVSLSFEEERELNLESISESDFEWTKSIKPSWLRLGQKFTNLHNLRISKQYEPKDKVQVGGSTFEIFDINEKDGEQYLRFTHNDVMSRPNWERRRGEEIGRNYPGLSFKQAKHNIDTGFWIPLTDCKFMESTNPNLVGKTKPDGSPYGHIYCLPDTSFEHMSNIKESNDFDWAVEVPASNSHRFFDINVCYNSFYDEDTGEDECVEGGSYFIKIPTEDVPDIWDYEAEDWYVAGPGDEGYDVIRYCEKNGLLDTTTIDDVEYVTELPKSEYCRAWGNYQTEDKELCGNLNESEFDWTDDIKPLVSSVDDMIHVGAIYRVNPERASSDGLDMLLKVTGVDELEVNYEIIVSNSEDEPVGLNDYVSPEHAKNLLNKKLTYNLDPYWIYQQHESINESEFDWAKETPQADEFVLGKKYFIDFTIEEGDEGVTSFRGVKFRREVLDMMESLGYDVKSIKATDIDFLYLNDEQYGGGEPIRYFDTAWDLITKPNTYIAHWDMAVNDEDLDEIYDYVREEKFTTLKPSDFLKMGDLYLKKT